jgi:putative tricarboxylic transport membrane protein
MMHESHVKLTIALLCNLGALVSPAAAQPFPSRPIELVAHSAPGAGNDRVARILAEILVRDKLINQPVSISNRTGGAGTVAYNYIKSKRGDPHVILTGVSNTLLGAALRPEFNVSLDQFTLLAMMALDPQAVIVAADSPYRTFKDLIDAAKREPNSLVASIGSPASAGRMLLWSIEQETGTRFKVVSMRGGADAIISVMGGHTHFSTENISEGMAALEAKKLRVLAVSTLQRMAVVPDTPTLKELGYNIHVGSARGFAMSAGVPKEAAAHMESILERVYHSTSWKAHAQASYYENVWMGSAEFTQYFNQRQEWVRNFLRAIGAVKA